MAKKYYAVKVGEKTGIYETWEECKANVDGYPGALYKSFKNISDAYAYLGQEGTQLSLFDTEAPKDEDDDTTFDSDMPITTPFHNGTETHLYDSGNDVQMASMRNVAGEIYGSMAAMKYALEKGIKKLSIYYDYMGIAKWCTGEWKTNKDGTIAYKKYYDKIKKSVDITFEKVKGHSGDKYNDLADSLAKKACGV